MEPDENGGGQPWTLNSTVTFERQLASFLQK